MSRKYGRIACIFTAQIAALSVAGVSTAADQAFTVSTVCNSNLVNVNMGGNGRMFYSGTSGNGHVICGIGQDQPSDTNDDVVIYYDDTNSNSLQNVGCYGYELNADWSTFVYSGTKYGCSTPGGCASSPTGAYAAAGHIRISGIQHGGGFATMLLCSIPPKVTTMSSINSIWLDEI